MKKNKKREGNHKEGFVSAFFPNPPRKEKLSFADSVGSCQGRVLLKADPPDTGTNSNK